MHVVMPVSRHDARMFRFMVYMWEHASLQHGGGDQLTRTQCIQAGEACTPLDASSSESAI